MGFVNDFQFSAAEVKKVKRMQFSVMSPDELRRMSVVEVKHEFSFERGRPKKDGIMDPRLGAIDREFPCQSCHCDERNCPGHFGHIELCKPVFNIGYFNMVYRILRCVCYYCSRLLMDVENLEDPQVRRVLACKRRQMRFKLAVKIAEKKTECHSCGQKQPKFNKAELKFEASVPQEGGVSKQVVSAEKVLNIFKRMTDEDIEALGLSAKWSRPEWFILTLMPVPPPHMRPSIMMNSSMRGEDDLTHKIGDIVRSNNVLRDLEKTGAPSHKIDAQISLLNLHVITYMNNSLPGMPRAYQKSGRAIKCISQRLKGKEGRVRGNLMGKRVDFSARTVITPDPCLRLDEVGVPRTIAMNLTFPEIVTPYNRERLAQYVANGPNEYPGAKYVERDDGQRIDLKFTRQRSSIPLDYGSKVIRHLITGDFIIFNRQPSLHKMSIMGHRVRVMPYSTFRLNLSVTGPYNADFDGDEMNLHVPQTHQTRAEVMQLMLVPRCIVSPQGNRPVMGIVQDTLVGSMLFTQRDTFLEKDFVMNVLLHVPKWNGKVPVPAILKPRPLWTGKQLFSLILPDVNIVRFANTHPDDEYSDISPGDTKVLIVGGELVTGIIDKRTIGAAANGMIHVTWKEHGPDTTRDLISDIQLLVNSWMLQRGFSIGIGDTIADEDTMSMVSSTIASAKEEVKSLVEKAQEGELELLPGKSMMESFESHVNKVLNGARDKSGASAQQSLLKTNNVKRMVSAGSKGSFINISQICACVGQQNVEGKRIAYGFSRRTLPHFVVDDLGPESRGFVENSYLRGLTASEFFFHAMGGREGLIDTAVKTSETGYIQRRLIKAMEDVMVKYDGTVRTSSGLIVQFLYGEDGMDGSLVEDQNLQSLRLNFEKLEKKYKLDPFAVDFGLTEKNKHYLEQDVIDKVRNDPELAKMLEDEYNQINADQRRLQKEIVKSDESKWPLPVNIDRLLWNAKRTFGIHEDSVSDLNPRQILAIIEVLLNRCQVVPMPAENPVIPKNATPEEISRLKTGRAAMRELAQEAQENATTLWQIHVRSMLATKVVLKEHRLSQTAFTWLSGEIENNYLKAICAPGEMIGAVAAQSIGEPATQMTLNTFHFAGVSAKNVTLGVPRLKEVINVAKNIKTPSLTVYLRGEAAKDALRAKQVQAQLQLTNLGHVTESTEIYYDPEPMQSVIKEDQELVDAYYELPDEDVNVSPWLLRIVLSKEMLTDRKISMTDIKNRIHADFPDDLNVMTSEDNAEKLVLRIRINQNEEVNKEMEAEEADDRDDQSFLKKLEGSLQTELNLGGIPGIRKVFMRQPKRRVVDEVHGGFTNMLEWVLDTDGVNLLEVMSHPDVDHTRTVSNDVIEMFRVLGIEGVRASLLNEIRNVISFDGSYVNYRHLAILVDVMTCRGHVMSITRHGINRVDSGALMRCSFEETTDILLEAATFAEEDLLKGPTESILLGQMAPLGTGEFGLLINEDALQLAMPDPEYSMTPGRVRSPARGMDTPGLRTPAVFDRAGTPSYGGAFTPAMGTPGAMSPGVYSPYGGAVFSPTPGTPAGLAGTEGYSPFGGYAAGAQSPGGFGGASPGGAYSPTSPSYNHTSPAMPSPDPYSGLKSPAYAPTSPTYNTRSPGYSPSSPAAFGGAGGSSYSPSSPHYSPTSPGYSPASPNFSPSSPNANPTQYSPTSPNYSPSSPNYSPASPNYSPSSPAYSPSSPAYSPSSPAYSPSSPAYSPSSPKAS